jgi:hypothetical protein
MVKQVRKSERDREGYIVHRSRNVVTILKTLGDLGVEGVTKAVTWA